MMKSERDSTEGNEGRLQVPTCVSLCFLIDEVSISPGLGKVCSFWIVFAHISLLILLLSCRRLLIRLKAQQGFQSVTCSLDYIFLLKLRDGLNLHLWDKCFQRWFCNYTAIRSPKIQPFNWVLDMLIVPLCQSKNKGHLSTGMPRSQVTGSSRAEHRTWPLGRREVAGTIWGSLKSLTSRSHRIGLEPTASSPVNNLKSFQSTSKHTVCTR